MERIFYSGDEIVTGSEIAHALVAYAGALARAGSSDAVDIPTRLLDGSTGRAEFLLGPASQLVVESVDIEGDELADAELVDRLTASATALTAARPVPSDEPPSPSAFDPHGF